MQSLLTITVIPYVANQPNETQSGILAASLPLVHLPRLIMKEVPQIQLLLSGDSIHLLHNAASTNSPDRALVLDDQLVWDVGQSLCALGPGVLQVFSAIDNPHLWIPKRALQITSKVVSFSTSPKLRISSSESSMLRVLEVQPGAMQVPVVTMPTWMSLAACSRISNPSRAAARSLGKPWKPCGPILRASKSHPRNSPASSWAFSVTVSTFPQT